MQTRRTFLKNAAGMGTAAWTSRAFSQTPAREAQDRPNIILIMTDDQGYGDIGAHGNEHLRTPNLDRLHDEGVRFSHFHVCPVCSPTRSSLMTGRYHYRTGIVDTFMGRSLMWPDEVTVAEMLAGSGYRTGIFGKWHLGDNYPMRAMDQGFEEVLVHRGGGLCQPSEPRSASYFNPLLQHNGVDEPSRGYCSDVFTDGALAFIEAHRTEPFFAYLAFNAPHVPLQVAERYSQPYLDMGLDEETAKVYGMVANIDENVGRVLDRLGTLGIDERTIVIFLTDNGPAMSKGATRYNAGMRGGKGTVYEGGIRVPFFMRWPGTLPAGRVVDRLAAHIDVMPTLLELCGVNPPPGVVLDGRSLAPLLDDPAAAWPDRTICIQWHRGDEPRPFENCAVLTQRFKLVNGKELYDLQDDPAEEHDVAAQHPDIVAQLRRDYETWLDDVGRPRGYAPSPIYLGTRHENPVMLTRQDWRGTDSWGKNHVGYWEVRVARAVRYDITATFPALEPPGAAHLQFGGVLLHAELPAGTQEHTFRGVTLPSVSGRLEVWTANARRVAGADYVVVEAI